MTLAEMKTLLERTEGFQGKVAYRAFPIGQAPALPFICFYSPGNNNFSADDLVFFSCKRIIIELYTEEKDETTEAALEATISDLYWTKDEEYIDDEKMYMITYEMEV